MMATVPDGVPEAFYEKLKSRQGSISHGDFTQMNRWFYYGLGGLRPDIKHPGFKRFDLVPQVPSELDHAAIWHQSPYGRIESAWRKENGKLIWNVTVPPNTRGTVTLPANSLDGVTESGEPLTKAEGVSVVDSTARSVLLHSGRYEFAIPQRGKP
jgi:alpha-L-rhamnosidase